MGNVIRTCTNLVHYAKFNLGMEEIDKIYAENLLFELLRISDVNQEDADASFVESLKVPDALLGEIASYALSQNIIEEGGENLFCTKVMGILSPRPSTVEKKFNDLHRNFGAQKACDYLYDLSIKNNYIKKSAIDKNILWTANYPNNFLEITINRSKPEKSNAEIAKLLKEKKSSYPSCVLCYENLGFQGTLSKEPRQNLRIVNLKLNGEDWFMQFSPYVYYEEHCIVISKKHRPMNVDCSTIDKLYDFTILFPNYFIGSNASLPIIGGSILNHEHFQGGRHKLPVMYAKAEKSYFSKKYEDVSLSKLNWYNSVLRITSENHEKVKSLAKKIISAWKTHNDEDNQIFSHSNGEPHNSVTPTVYFTEDNLLCIDLILRNNLTTEEYPDGLFHAHPEHHNIKKEGIGIIEALGMFILPGRLVNETKDIAEFLSGEKTDLASLQGTNMQAHAGAIKTLLDKNGNNLSKQQCEQVIKQYINDTCKNILKNTAVYKDDEKGNKGMNKFINSLGFMEE